MHYIMQWLLKTFMKKFMFKDKKINYERNYKGIY